MNKTRERRYWVILALFICIVILLAITHQQAATKMIANTSFSHPNDPYDPNHVAALQSQQVSMDQNTWIVSFIIPAILMLTSYSIHGYNYYNDKLDYINKHKKPSDTRLMIHLLIAFMFLIITGTIVGGSFYIILALIAPVLILLYPLILIFFYKSGTILCNAILIPESNDKGTE